MQPKYKLLNSANEPANGLAQWQRWDWQDSLHHRAISGKKRLRASGGAAVRWRRCWATPSLALLQQEWADAIGPGANHIPVPVIALRPDTKEDAQAKLKPIAG